MADPVTATLAIGSKVVGSIAGARAANAQERQRNQAALDQHNVSQYNAEAQVIQANMRGRLRAAAVARQNRQIEKNSLRELFTNAESLDLEQTQKRKDIVTKSKQHTALIEQRAMQSNIQSNSAMAVRMLNLQVSELQKAMGDTKREFGLQRQNLVETRKKQLASRGDETFVAQRFYRGSPGTFYDNSSARNMGAFIESAGHVAGGIHGYNN